MAILHIDNKNVQQRCDACGFDRVLGLDVIEIGVIPDADGHLDVDGDGRANPVIALPSCNRCGAVELLQLPEHDHEEQAANLAVLWQRLGGEPLDVSMFEHERSTEDLSLDDSSTDH